MLNKETIDYVEGIDVPAFDLRSIRARRVKPISNAFRQRAIAAAAAALLVVFVSSGPAVLAQVERTLRAFVTIGGRMEAVPVQGVTLEEARARVPFTVVAPAAIPAGYQGSIDEIDAGPSPFDARLIFRFSNGAAPGFTIMESSAMQAGMKQRLWMTTGKNGALPRLPALPASATGHHAFVEFHGNGVTRRISVEPISWTVGGTRIDLVVPPGLLSKAQIEAMRRSML
jgi:hypothetical protein